MQKYLVNTWDGKRVKENRKEGLCEGKNDNPTLNDDVKNIFEFKVKLKTLVAVTIFNSFC